MNKNIDDFLLGGYKLVGKKQKEIACLVLHGFAASPKELLPLNRFLRSSFDIYAPLLPGHGTTIEDLDKRKHTEWLFSANAIYNELNKMYEKVVIIGFSMGGTIGLYLSRRKQPYKLITISTPIDLLDLKFLTKRIKEQWKLNNFSMKLIIDEFEKVSKKKVKVDKAIDKTRLVINNLYKKLYNTKLKTANTESLIKYFDTYDSLSYQAIKELLFLIHKTNKILNRVKAPLLVIHSTKDEIVPVSNANIILTQTYSSSAEKLIVHNSTHQIPLDLDCQIVQKKIREFIRRKI